MVVHFWTWSLLATHSCNTIDFLLVLVLQAVALLLPLPPLPLSACPWGTGMRINFQHTQGARATGEALRNLRQFRALLLLSDALNQRRAASRIVASLEGGTGAEGGERRV